MSGVRQRLYGVLFFARPETRVQEWIMTGSGSLERPRFVTPVLPPQDLHPGLELLWQDRNERAFAGSAGAIQNGENERWRIFTWIIHPSLALEPGRIQDCYLFMVCQLYIMQHEHNDPVLRPDEVKVFILMTMRIQDLSSSQALEPMDFVPRPRPVHLATLYSTSILSKISKGVGEVIARKWLLPCNNFHGPLFHKCKILSAKIWMISTNLFVKASICILYARGFEKNTRLMKSLLSNLLIKEDLC